MNCFYCLSLKKKKETKTKMFFLDHYGSVRANDKRIHPNFIVSMNTSFENELRRHRSLQSFDQKCFSSTPRFA